jgi:lipopolysaccharide/colanic/teichoic acid biosynthesis glycosyltransferase
MKAVVEMGGGQGGTADAELITVSRLVGTRAPSARRSVDSIVKRGLRTPARPGPFRGAAGVGIRARPADFWLKRSLDLVVAVAGAAFYLPIIVAAVLAVQFVDRGPIFYAQVRRGHGGRPIRVWKLRTMYRDSAARLERHLMADPRAQREWCRYFKLRRDPRVLPWVGDFLRRSSIDELPQIWNLIRGEMTLVGPRPLPDYHLDAFDREFRRLRQSVVPGLTGLWQVAVRSDGDCAALRRLDSYYIKNWSLRLDLSILLRTVRVVLTGRGAR